MKRIISFIMTVSVIVSMLCIGTVPASAFDTSQGNDVYFYAKPQTLDEAVASMTQEGAGYVWELTYGLYGNPDKYYGFASGNIESRILGMDNFIEYYDVQDYATNISFVKIGSGRGSYTPMSLNSYAAAATKYPADGIQFAFIARTGANRDPRPVLKEGNSFGLESGLLGEWKIKYYITDLEAFKAAAKAKTLHFTADIYDDKNYGQDLVAYLPDENGGVGQVLSLQRKDYPAPKPLDYYLTVDEEPATDPYYTYTGDNANGYTIAFTDAYKNAIVNNLDYVSDDGTDTYWTADAPIKDPQYNGKNVSYAASLFSGMQLSKVDLTEFTLVTSAMKDMFKGFLGNGDGIPAVGIAKDDATAEKYNADITSIDKTNLYFGNVTIMNYNNGSAFTYVYDNRTTVSDESTTAVTIGNVGKNNQYVEIGKYFIGFKNAAKDYNGNLITIDYSDTVKTKDIDTYLTTTQTEDKTANTLRLKLDAQSVLPQGVNISKAMAQKVKKADGTNIIRFLALVDKGYADYKETGFVLSGIGINPTRQAGYQYKGTNLIYKKLRALDAANPKGGAVLMDIDKLNGLFAFANGAGFEYTELKIPTGKEGTTYYATPYIILADGTIVYGETKATSFTVLSDNDQKAVE